MGGILTPDLSNLAQGIAPVKPWQAPAPKAAESDTLSNEDLAALTESWHHLDEAKDPRADKLRKYIGQQANSILHPEQAPDTRGMLHRAWDWANQGMISKDTVVKAMTGMSPEDLNKALAPRAEDTPGQAAQAEFWRGVMQDTAGVSSGLTSPLSAATIGLGAAGKLPGTVGTLARAAAVPTSIAFGAGGAADVAEAGLSNKPEAWQQRLQGASQMAMGASGALDPEAVRTSAAAGKSLVTRPAAAIKAGTAGAVEAIGAQIAPEPHELMTKALKPTAGNTEFDSAIKTAMPELKAAEADIGRPIAGVTDALEATSAAKKKVWSEYQAKLDQAKAVDAGPLQTRDPKTGKLQPVTNEPTINGHEIADAMEASVTKRQAQLNPQLAERVKAAAQTYRKPMMLGDAEDFLQDANNELHSYYAKNKVGRRAATADPEMAATVAEAEQLRDSLYSKLDELTGPGAKDIKQRYGALSNVENELLRRKNVAARQQPESLAEQIGKAAGYGKIVGGAGAALAGHPGIGVTLAGEGVMQAGLSKWLKGRQTTDAMISKAFENYGQPESTARRLLRGERGEAGPPGTVEERQTVGTQAGADRDTLLFQQARRELGNGASLSDVAQRAQQLKAGTVSTEVEPGMRRTPEDTRRDIARASQQDPILAQHEANMRQRAAEAATNPATVKLGNQPQAEIKPPAEKLPSYYEKYGKVAEQPDVEPFYSKAEKAAKMLPGTATGQQILSTLRNQGVKPGELENLGMEDFLKSKGKFNRQEVVDYISKNKLSVGEKDLVQNPEPVVKENQYGRSTTVPQGTKYESYTLPGEKQNYTEKLFTLPTEGPVNKATLTDRPDGSTLVRLGNQTALVRGQMAAEAMARQMESDPANTKANKGTFQSSHWDEPNVLAHARFDERTAADGKKVLFMEEAQSDWHQKGKKEGYYGPEGPQLVNKRNVDVYQGVPDAPFKTDWHELVMKRMLREAAERGADRLAWTTGEQQAERYDLSKQVGKLYYYPEHQNLIVYDQRGNNVIKNIDNVPPEKLADYVGKDGADKLLKSPTDRFGGQKLEGEGLKIGGEWAKALYDRAIPNFLNKYAKKWGAKVGETQLGAYSPKFAAEEGPEDWHVVDANNRGDYLHDDGDKLTNMDDDDFDPRAFRNRSQAEAWIQRNKNNANFGSVHSNPITKTRIQAMEFEAPSLQKFLKERGIKAKPVGQPNMGGQDYEFEGRQDDLREMLRDQWSMEEGEINQFVPKVPAGGHTIHSIEITPAMKKAVMKEGQPIASAATFGDERAG